VMTNARTAFITFPQLMKGQIAGAGASTYRVTIVRSTRSSGQ
jgi:hypothetical protein